MQVTQQNNFIYLTASLVVLLLAGAMESVLEPGYSRFILQALSLIHI